MLDLLVNGPGNVDLPRFRKTLDPRSNVDTIAIDIIRVDDHVAEVDAEPVFDPGLSWERRIAAKQVLLDDNTAPDSLDGTVESRDEAIPCGLDQLAVMFGDARFNEIALDPPDAASVPSSSSCIRRL